MTDEPNNTSKNSAANTPAPGTGSLSNAYVRQPRPHATQGTIDDLNSGVSGSAPLAGTSATPNARPGSSFSHESSFTVSSHNPLQSRSYRRARSDQAKVRQELKYGQYLSVPKGSREIFSSRERQTTQRRAIIGIILVAVVIILLVLFWPK